MPDALSKGFHYRIVSISAAMCALLVCLMVAISIAQGVGYQDFESILNYADTETFSSRLLEAAPTLRTLYPLDTLYIFAYLTMVFAIVQVTDNRKKLGLLACIAAVATASLDFVENNHILAMAAAAERGYAVGISQITFETVVTQTKFNAGLLLTLCLSFLIQKETWAGALARWLARALVLFAPIALLAPATTLAYITMNVVFAGLIAIAYAGAAASQPSRQAVG